MALNKKLILLLSFLLFIVVCIKASSIVVTFFISLTFAYFLQPVAKKLENKTRIAYHFSAIIIFLLFITILFGSLTILIPKILSQLELLIERIPQFQNSIKTIIIPAISEKLDLLGPTVSEQIKHSSLALVGNFGNALNTTTHVLWDYLLSTINLITMCLLMPILLFFFLKDWPRLVLSFKNFVTQAGFHEINDVFVKMDVLVTGFIKGLFNVAIILSIFYTIALGIIGYEFALISGIIAGLAILVPFIGPLLAAISCLIISLLLHGISSQLLYVLIVFAIGQTIDASYLTPKIVGDKIGFHPTAIIFSVFVGSHILGAAGLFLAIPIAGMIKIIYDKFIFKA